MKVGDIIIVDNGGRFKVLSIDPDDKQEIEVSFLGTPYVGLKLFAEVRCQKFRLHGWKRSRKFLIEQK